MNPTYPPTGGAVKSVSCPFAFARPRPALHLDRRAKRKTICTKRGTRREALRLEVREIDFVEFRPLRHVGEHDQAFEDIVERASRSIQYPRDVFHHLTGFGFNAARHEFRSAGALAD